MERESSPCPAIGACVGLREVGAGPLARRSASLKPITLPACSLGQPVDREYIKPRICKSLNKKKGWLKRVGNGYTLLTPGEQQS